MIAKTARVRDFKSITDSGEVCLDESVICLVGKNESGKTAFVEPIYRINPVPTGHPDKFVRLRDYPRSRHPRERDAAGDKRPIEITYELEQADLDAINTELGNGVMAPGVVTVWRSYDNEYEATFEFDESKAVTKLLADADLDPQLGEGCSTVPQLREKLAADQEPTEAVQALVARIANLDVKDRIEDILLDRMPRVLYFNEYSALPGRVSIPLLQNRSEQDLDAEERTALALLRLAGVDTDDFSEEDYEARKAALEAAANAITAEVFEYWSQNKDLLVDLDLDFKAPSTGHGEDAPFLDIRIRNLRHQVTLNFSERSRGFVWFFSFLVAFSEYRDSGESLVLLLDEPGLGLHGAAQADLLRYIEERLAPEHQVIYTTHSPFMIDPTRLDRVRMVEDVKDRGTKVSEDVLGIGRDTVFPLQAALGYELAQTLFVSPNNLVVEGPADYLYLTILSGRVKADGKVGLDDRWTIVPVGGLDKIPTFVALLGSQLNVAVMMDASSGGSQKINSLIERGVIDARSVIPLNSIAGTKEADIEDLFDEDFYLQLVKRSGAASVTKTKLAGGGRIVKRIESALGGPYDHYRPARYFLEHQTEFLETLDEPTLERFEKLFAELNKLVA